MNVTVHQVYFLLNAGLITPAEADRANQTIEEAPYWADRCPAVTMCAKTLHTLRVRRILRG